MADCLSCRHAGPNAGPDGRIDFNSKVCRESPPTPVVVGVGPGGPIVQALFPVVGRGCACSRHDPRLLGDEIVQADAGKPS